MKQRSASALCCQAARQQIGRQRRGEKRNSDDWESMVLECPRCGWKGTFYQGDVELFAELMDCKCPKCPWPNDPILAIVSYATLDDLERNWGRMSAASRDFARKAYGIDERQLD